MSSGRIAIINADGDIITSAEFVGGPTPTDMEKRTIKFLKYVNNLNGFFLAVTDFSLVTYKNNDEPLTKQVSGDWYNTCYDYANKWHSDYVSIKNLSSRIKCFVTPDSFVLVEPNEILTLYQGRLLEEDDDKLININVGDVVTVADIEWIVLKKTDDSVYCLTKDLIDTRKFDDDTSNYAKSYILTYLRIFEQTIKNKVGEDALIPREIDLTTNEGKTLYGKITDVIGLLTETEYKEFESIIKRYPVSRWWWLATADSRWSNTVRCVNVVGSLDNDYCCRSNGVRPFCIFSSKIF